jgi:hypothetical protein
MGSLLKRASVEDTFRYYHENGEDYLDLRVNISKRDATNLFKNAPDGERDIEGGQRFLEQAFAIIVQGWSLTEEDGSPVVPNIDEYYALDAVATKWIDESIGAHLPKLFGTKVEELEKKDENSRSTALEAKTSRRR